MTETGVRLWVHGMLPEVFAAEIAAPLVMEARDARARLGKAGLIRGKKEGDEVRWATKQSVPGSGQPRLIVVEPSLLEGGAGG